jgi:N-acetyl sugar amidotransferase
VNYANRVAIDWENRRAEFVALMEDARSSKTTAWDCIVPVSGGKDSTFQVLKIKELGFNPLAVTSTTCDMSPIGQRNLDNLRRIGVDHVALSPNPRVRAKLNRIGLEEVGDISWPEHVGIFTIPVRASVMFKVPLIVWGENSQNEYGGPPAMADNQVLDRRWLEEFGGLLGLRVTDLAKSYGIGSNDLELYTYPSDEDLRATATRGVFLGYFFPWDGLNNAVNAQASGFETWPRVVQGSAASYENLDNYQTGIHDYFKFLKFGFGRASDILSMHVRRGRIERSEAIRQAAELEGKFPGEYLDKSLVQILDPLGLSLDKFAEICDAYTNLGLFETAQDGSLVRDQEGNLKKTNYDNLPAR